MDKGSMDVRARTRWLKTCQWMEDSLLVISIDNSNNNRWMQRVVD